MLLPCSSTWPSLGLKPFKNCFSVGPLHRLKTFRKKWTPVWVIQGPEFLSGEPAPVWAPPQAAVPSGNTNLSSMGFSSCCSVGICPIVVSSIRYKGIPALTPAAPPLFFSDPGVHTCFSHLFSLLLTLPWNVLTFLKYDFTELPPVSLMGSVVSYVDRWVSWSQLEWSVSSTGIPWLLLIEATHAAPWCQHLDTHTQHIH